MPPGDTPFEKFLSLQNQIFAIKAKTHGKTIWSKTINRFF
jgi:hypothetical protein